MRIRGLRYYLVAFLLLEVASFVVIGKWLGVLATVAMVFFSGLAGLMLLKHSSRQMGEQMRMAIQMQNSFFFQNNPNLTPFAAILLIIPGFVSDIMAVLLLFGPIRRRIESRIRSSNKTGSRIVEGQCSTIDTDKVAANDDASLFKK